MTNQRLELTWIGKDKLINPEPRILIKRDEFCYGTRGSGNLLIHGDNLLALRSLEQDYLNKIRLIAIDPPYNTMSAFSHYDDNVEHSTWLSLMKPRLELLRSLLSSDGSIWICIDDYERDYLKLLCDEVFGRCNFVASIVWQKRTSPDARLAISTAHDYVLVYAKDKDVFMKTVNKVPLNAVQKARYKNPDNDPRGPWVTSDFSAQIGHATPDQFYEIVGPSGKKHKPPANRCWRMIESSYLKLLEDGRMWFGKDGNGVPYKKMYLSETEGYSAWTWWGNDDVGHNKEAKQEIMELFGRSNVFDTPKPERLIQRILELATNLGDIVLDSFLGSGTTAAVAHKMGRRWIGIELGDHAYTHCKVRLDKVIDGEQGGISKAIGWQGGGGYDFYTLAPTLINIDKIGMPIISKEYNAEMLAAAMAKHANYHYEPCSTTAWKQGWAGESRAKATNFIFTVTGTITAEYLDWIAMELKPNENLLICATSYAPECVGRHKNIVIKKIPQVLLGKCEFGVTDYCLNVIEELANFEYEEDSE